MGQGECSLEWQLCSKFNYVRATRITSSAEESIEFFFVSSQRFFFFLTKSIFCNFLSSFSFWLFLIRSELNCSESLTDRETPICAAGFKHSSFSLSHTFSFPLSLSLVHSLTPVHTHSLSLLPSFFLSLSRVGKIILRFSLMTDKWLKKTRNLHLQRESKEREREHETQRKCEQERERAREREWVRVAMHPLKHYFFCERVCCEHRSLFR